MHIGPSFYSSNLIISLYNQCPRYLFLFPMIAPRFISLWDSLVLNSFSSRSLPTALQSKFRSSGKANSNREARVWVRDPSGLLHLNLDCESLTSATLEGHSGFFILVVDCSKNSEQRPDLLHLTPPCKSPTGWLGRNPAKHSAATHVFTHTPAPAAFTGRCPHMDLPRPPTVPSLPWVLDMPPLLPHLSVVSEHV